jgi:hypothetical protein
MSRRRKWTGHVAPMVEKKKARRKDLLRARPRWEDNIKMDLREMK